MASKIEAQGPAEADEPELSWLPRERASFLIASLGSVTRVAETLGVSKSQPTRWRNGQERPSVAVATRLLDLDHVLARAMLLWPREVALDWLESPNSYLDHARPIDVLQTRGAGEVLDAIDSALSGTYA